MHAILWGSGFGQKLVNTLSEMDFLQVLNLLVTGLASEAEEGPNQIHWWCWLDSTRHNISKRKFASQASIFCIYFSSLIFHTPAEKPIYSDHAIVFTAQTSKPVFFILVSWSLRTVSVTFQHGAHKSLLLTDMHRIPTTVARGNGIQQGKLSSHTTLFQIHSSPSCLPAPKVLILSLLNLWKWQMTIIIGVSIV